ncbi:DUF1800 domain-containing protein [Thalassotalea litorea]|uniref:DUF1800 domain-containing protein n=1 Tax=Thalassotalea litorea TaxID=2020715 RepID=A0A5R9IPI8_9GAMM|nr:DUF1800 domain-containing protein [Thalassotalea litorea]TLU66393.1 DUF1800 domain-containing protein [Thalassotalea litorea]
MSEQNMKTHSLNRALIATNRFGYGARQGEMQKAQRDPKGWVIGQLKTVEFDPSLPGSDEVLHAFYQYQQQQRKKKSNQNIDFGDDEIPKNFSRKTLQNASADGLIRSIQSSDSVSWRLLDFFSNHFSVTANNRLMAGLATTLEREAIAPNLIGRFEDMLLAITKHPAMLMYLNNERSFGPNSLAAKKRGKGLNENLAREILELHTLGVDGPYSQQDVIELAKGISGWSVKHPKREEGNGFVFRNYGHEPGKRTLLGRSYRQNGMSQGEQMLRDLATHPATAKHICRKLAFHFVSENPPKSLLDKMQQTWRETDGNIKSVMTTLFRADESWIAEPQKFKTPREFVISSYRAFGIREVKQNSFRYSLNNLGQQPFNANSPAGYSDKNEDWLGPSALMARIDWSAMVGGYQKWQKIEKILSTSLGSQVSQHTYNSVMRAESREQSIALFLMSPEFQWR